MHNTIFRHTARCFGVIFRDRYGDVVLVVYVTHAFSSSRTAFWRHFLCKTRESRCMGVWQARRTCSVHRTQHSGDFRVDIRVFVALQMHWLSCSCHHRISVGSSFFALPPYVFERNCRPFIGGPVRKYVLETHFLIRAHVSGNHFY